MRVAVAGRGLGGLCLAQGLLKAGVDVTVYERDASLAARRQGYRLHVGARAGLALEQCLSPESFAVFQATCGEAGTRLTVMWAVAADRGRFGVRDDELTAMTPVELHALSARLIRTWHPDLRALHGQAAVDETFLVRIRASRPVPAWPPSRVTVLGDAIHAMSPARGSGANTALQDAALLCRTLAPTPGNRALGNGTDGDLIAAVGAYERQMRDYGYAAAAASRQAEAETGARHNRLMFWLYRRMAGARA